MRLKKRRSARLLLRDANATKRMQPFAQRAADKFFGTRGKRNPEKLLEEQRKVYEFIKERGKATKEEILNKFRMKPGKLGQIMIVLRRFKLTKGAKIDDKIYCVPWEYEHEGEV